jgi:Ni/Co efflux regulator RcnB
MMKMMMVMMMVEMTNQFFIYLLIQRPSGQVQRQHKYKDRTKTIEENSKDRTKKKIKKHHHYYQGAKIPGARSL